MDDGSLFGREIEAHLELQRRNRRLEQRMPLDLYRNEIDSGLLEDEPLSAERQPPEQIAPAVEHGFPAEDPDSWWGVRDDPETAEFGWRS